MSDFVDPYVDPKHGVLRNLLNLTDKAQLLQVESDIATAGELDPAMKSIPRTNDLAELCAIHRQLFRDIYDWAGEIRTVDIRKDDGSSEFFLIRTKIPVASNFVFTELQQNNYLQNLQKDDFVKKLSYFYDQLNFIHPFREGNGRTQRIFWNRVALDAGYQIDWTKAVGAENDQASKLAAETQDLGLLQKMFERIISIKP